VGQAVGNLVVLARCDQCVDLALEQPYSSRKESELELVTEDRVPTSLSCQVARL